MQPTCDDLWKCLGPMRGFVNPGPSGLYPDAHDFGWSVKPTRHKVDEDVRHMENLCRLLFWAERARHLIARFEGDAFSGKERREAIGLLERLATAIQDPRPDLPPPFLDDTRRCAQSNFVEPVQRLADDVRRSISIGGTIRELPRAGDPRALSELLLRIVASVNDTIELTKIVHERRVELLAQEKAENKPGTMLDFWPVAYDKSDEARDAFAEFRQLHMPDLYLSRLGCLGTSGSDKCGAAVWVLDAHADNVSSIMLHEQLCEVAIQAWKLQMLLQCSPMPCDPSGLDRCVRPIRHAARILGSFDPESSKSLKGTAITPATKACLEVLVGSEEPMLGPDLKQKAGYSFQRPMRWLCENGFAAKPSERGGYIATAKGRSLAKSF